MNKEEISVLAALVADQVVKKLKGVGIWQRQNTSIPRKLLEYSVCLLTIYAK